MTSYIPGNLGGGSLGGIQLALAACFESRQHTISKLTVPRAQFAGDTAVTLTDGSLNTRPSGINAAIPRSSTAFLANTTNTNDGTTSLGKPLVIKVKRDELSSEIRSYGVFNADGTFPGASSTTPNDPAFDPYDATKARYLVNAATGEIYLNNATGIRPLVNPDGTLTIDDTAWNLLSTGQKRDQGVVGLVEFEALQGGAASVAQQQAAELSSVIQSLTSILRSVEDGRKGILGIIR